MMIVDRFVRLAVFALVATSLPACVVSSSDNDNNPNGSGGSGGTLPNPEGPIAHDANEAWPKKPASVPVITPEQLVQACVEYTACAMKEPSAPDPMITVSFCVSELIWSIERAIPVSQLLKWNERGEYFVKCQLDHAGDCTAQKSCSSGRDSSIACQEDGCHVTGDVAFTVTCNGNVAHLAGNNQSFDRDCAVAYAECDPQSETGCTDRPFTACPPETSTKDRCDGNIRLGCDGSGQVSYHDCSLLGGVCGTASDGSKDCIYKNPPDPQCTDKNDVFAACESGMVGVCVNGARISVNGAGVCPAV